MDITSVVTMSIMADGNEVATVQRAKNTITITLYTTDRSVIECVEIAVNELEFSPMFKGHKIHIPNHSSWVNIEPNRVVRFVYKDID